MPEVQDIACVADAVEQAVRRHKGIAHGQFTQTAPTASQQSYRRRTEVDTGLSQTQSHNQYMRIVRQATNGESIQAQSDVAVPGICAAGIQKEGGVDQEEVKTPETIRYSRRVGHKVADRCEVCADSMLYKRQRSEVLPVYNDR